MPEVIMTWANRKHAPEDIELVTAWDEYSIDANGEGWKEDKQKHLDAMGSDLLRHVDVTVSLPFEKIRDALNPEPIRFEV